MVKRRYPVCDSAMMTRLQRREQRDFVECSGYFRSKICSKSVKRREKGNKGWWYVTRRQDILCLTTIKAKFFRTTHVTNTTTVAQPRNKHIEPISCNEISYSLHHLRRKRCHNMCIVDYKVIGQVHRRLDAETSKTTSFEQDWPRLLSK